MDEQLTRFMNIMMELVRIYQPTMREDLLVEKAIKASAEVQQDTAAIEAMIRRQTALTESIDRDIQATRDLLESSRDERIRERAEQVRATLESCRAYILAYRAACEQVLQSAPNASMTTIFSDCDEARGRYEESFRRFRSPRGFAPGPHEGGDVPLDPRGFRPEGDQGAALDLPGVD